MIKLFRLQQDECSKSTVILARRRTRMWMPFGNWAALSLKFPKLAFSLTKSLQTRLKESLSNAVGNNSEKWLLLCGMTWAICSTHSLLITNHMSTSFNESEKCSKLRFTTWGRKWLPWGMAVRIALVEAHTRVVTPSVFYPRTYHLNKATPNQHSSIMRSRLVLHKSKCSVHRAHIVSQAAMGVEAVHIQVAHTVQTNSNKESKVNKKQ